MSRVVYKTGLCLPESLYKVAGILLWCLYALLGAPVVPFALLLRGYWGT